MDIQSLSICVPSGCPNKCKFCCARMKADTYVDQIEENMRFRELYKKDFKRRLEFCRDNGCHVVVLTGDGEPMMNIHFLNDFSEWNESISSPFKRIELQTSGVTLDDKRLRWLRNTIGVSTISVSLSNVWSNEGNQEYNGTPEQLKVDIEKLCSEIKRYDFNLRLSLNMTDAYNGRTPIELFDRCHALSANQVTLRVLYESGGDTPQDEWIRVHKASAEVLKELEGFILSSGRKLEILSFGAQKWSVGGISVVLDNDCMSTAAKETLRYAVLRPNCRLYSKWDDEGSLVF